MGTPSSTQIRMASRLPILLLLCLIPLLASALGEEERSHEVDAPLAELQASVVKREEKKRRVAKRGRRVPKRMAGPERRTAPEEEGNRQGHEKETMATNQSLIEDKDRGIQKQRKT